MLFYHAMTKVNLKFWRVTKGGMNNLMAVKNDPRHTSDRQSLTLYNTLRDRRLKISA